MKQLIASVTLLALILASGIFLEKQMENTHHPQADCLDRASQSAAAGNWEQAEALMTQARKGWEESRDLTAALAHHDPLNSIDTRFAELAIYADTRDEGEFRAACAALAHSLRSIPKSHGLHWWNLL